MLIHELFDSFTLERMFTKFSWTKTIEDTDDIRNQDRSNSSQLLANP